MQRTFASVVGLFLMGSLGPACVLADINFTVDENGIGAVQGRFLGGQNGADPFDPTNGLTPLNYRVALGPGLVPGDIVLGEGPGSGTISDLIRFTVEDPTTGEGSLILYSLVEPAGPQDLADVGLPSSRQTNLLTLPETVGPGGQIGLFDYTPTPNQPGYVPLPSGLGPVRYNVISTVPEAPGLALLATGAVGLLACAARRRARSRA